MTPIDSLINTLASEAGLFRTPVVGDHFQARAFKPSHPEWCTKFYDDWCPAGKGGTKLVHGEKYGPVVEVRLVTYPSTEAAHLLTMPQGDRVQGKRYKGRGIAVAIPHPSNPEVLVYVNLTNDQYSTPT